MFALSLSLSPISLPHYNHNKYEGVDDETAIPGLLIAITSAEVVITALHCEHTHTHTHTHIYRSLLQWLGEDRSGWSDSDSHEQCL